MSPIVHAYDWPDRVVVGTLGTPGRRTFYLQARQSDRSTSVALEKEQALALAERLDSVLDELMTSEDNRFSVPESAPEGLSDHDPLDGAPRERFRVGIMTLGWDPSTAQVVLEAHAFDPDQADATEIDPSTSTEVLVVRLPVGMARAFTERTRRIVFSGRPMCPVCSRPMDDPTTHVCDWTEIP